MKKMIVWMIVAMLAVAAGYALAWDSMSPESYQSWAWDALWNYLSYISPEQYQSVYAGK